MQLLFGGNWLHRFEGRLRLWATKPLSVWLLTPLRTLAWGGVHLHRHLRPQPPAPLPVPIISIGNLVLGGTGKTPLTQWLCERLKAIGERPAILSPLPKDADEVQEHHLFAPVYSGRDRVASALQALADGATVLVLDDGFQYRRLCRDVDIVLWDATNWLHPANPFLREPLTALRRATAIVLSRLDAVTRKVAENLRDELNRWSGTEKVVAAFSYEPLPVAMKEAPKQVIAVTSVANPLYFVHTAKKAGFEVLTLICFPDHYPFTLSDAAWVIQQAKRVGAQAVLVTKKDAVKWRDVWQSKLPLVTLTIQLHWWWGEERLWEIVASRLPRKGGALA